jgi:hypothetical protein
VKEELLHAVPQAIDPAAPSRCYLTGKTKSVYGKKERCNRAGEGNLGAHSRCQSKLGGGSRVDLKREKE